MVLEYGEQQRRRFGSTSINICTQGLGYYDGDPDVVIAIIDDGFDLDHPVFAGKSIHPAKRDFASDPPGVDPLPSGSDYHGTCVASIATAGTNGQMLGVAPGCTFLPIRIPLSSVSMTSQLDLIQVFRYVSLYADVANCSFGTPPGQVDFLDPGFREELTTLTERGGRLGKGLVLIFSAGDDDAPTHLDPSENVNGLKYVQPGTPVNGLVIIPPGVEIFSGYSMTPGVIVVAAVSSLTRKAGYSGWGPHITIAAPSSNMHPIVKYIQEGQHDDVRNQFIADYRGLDQVAAINQSDHGARFRPIDENSDYTNEFGGTSGAAPLVAGTAGLMLSVNPNLSAADVYEILIETADTTVDMTLDLPNDPNLQGMDGKFVENRSAWFGYGRVNTLAAVERARIMGSSANGHV